MDFYGLRLEYALEGSSNYIDWKNRMEAVGLKEFIHNDIHKPPTSDASDLAEWRKCVAKARRIILEGVRDHIVSNIHGKETPFAMWKILMDLFQNKSEHRKLVLKEKLIKIKMEKDESISKYLIKFTLCQDELGSVGITVAEDDLEEFRQNTKYGSSSKVDDEENCALAGKEKKGKGKSSPSKSDSCHGGKKKDMSKVKCFHYHKLRHFATNCPLNKANKKFSGGARGEALASQFELDFTLITCMVSSMMGSVWYLDSGASFHITGNKELFTNLEDKDLQMHIEMGDDGSYITTKIGIVTFRRESDSPITL
eukprot:PITA_11571